MTTPAIRPHGTEGVGLDEERSAEDLDRGVHAPAEDHPHPDRRGRGEGSNIESQSLALTKKNSEIPFELRGLRAERTEFLSAVGVDAFLKDVKTWDERSRAIVRGETPVRNYYGTTFGLACTRVFTREEAGALPRGLLVSRLIREMDEAARVVSSGAFSCCAHVAWPGFGHVGGGVIRREYRQIGEGAD